MRSFANVAACRDRSAVASASMIGAASSGDSVPSATRRRMVSSSSGIRRFSGQARRRLLHVDLAALEGLEHFQLLVLAQLPTRRTWGRRRRGAEWRQRRERRERWERWERWDDGAAPSRAADDDVAGHRAEQQVRLAAADDEPAAVA